MLSLKSLGWSPFFQEQFDQLDKNFFPARVTVENKQRYILYCEKGEVSGEITGRLLYTSESAADLPKTGDWVAGILFESESKIIIHDLLKRRTKISRKTPDKKTDEQIIAANVDIVFIVQGADDNFNIRRLERYAAMVSESGARPYIILNKSDLNSNISEKSEKISQSFPSIPLIVSSAMRRSGIGEIKEIIGEGITAAFVGSSGVGKSSLINSLAGSDIQPVNEVRSADSKGKHTTTKRELILLSSGGMVIDTPGMRELQLWDAASGLGEVFDDVEMLELKCKFSDCGHANEEGCAVKAALSSGQITPDRIKSYLKLKRELEYLDSKIDRSAFLLKKQKEKDLHKKIKKVMKDSPKR